jgi:WD40 repeat protein
MRSTLIRSQYQFYYVPPALTTQSQNVLLYDFAGKFWSHNLFVQPWQSKKLAAYLSHEAGILKIDTNPSSQTTSPMNLTFFSLSRYRLAGQMDGEDEAIICATISPSGTTLASGGKHIRSRQILVLSTHQG